MADRKAPGQSGKSAKGQYRRAGIALFLLLLVAALAVGGSLAAYTHQSYVKGVAATNESEILFLSDNLRRCHVGTASNSFSLQKLIVSTVDESNVSIAFFIRNYVGAQTNENRIEYALSVSPSGSTGAYEYSLKEDSGSAVPFTSAAPYSHSYTMEAMQQTQHSFTLVLPRAALAENVSFTVTATPSEPKTTGGYMLAAILQPSERGTATGGVSCTGAFADQSEGNAPYQLDAFNYSVTVANADGAVNVTLTWKNTYVEPDPFFIAEKTVTTSGESSSVTFPVENGSYLVQFYRTQAKANSGWQATWDAMRAANVITVTHS